MFNLGDLFETRRDKQNIYQAEMCTKNLLSLDPLVDDDSHGVFADVENSSGFAVVGLVWHSLLEGAAALDVDNVSDLVGLEIGGQMLHSLLLVPPGEHVPGAATVTFRIRHPAVLL